LQEYQLLFYCEPVKTETKNWIASSQKTAPREDVDAWFTLRGARSAWELDIVSSYFYDLLKLWFGGTP